MGDNRLNSDSSIEQLGIMPLNSEEATSLIIERAKQLVNQLIECRGHNKLPFLPEEFSHILDIRKIVKADLGGTSAILLRFHDGYVIKVNGNHHVVRQNFSCAHEIGHILFSELKLEHYIHSIEYRKFNPSKTVEIRARARERLCDAAATELLMPEFIFRKYLSNFGLSVSSIEHLANIFKVSAKSAAIRVAEVSLESCIALFWEPRLRNEPKVLKLAMCKGPGIKFFYYVPVHTNIRYPSILHKAYEDDSPVKCYKKFERGNDVKRLPMESKGFGRKETRYVISLAFPDR